MTSLRVGIVGVTGYTGVELLKLVLAHPGLEVELLAATSAGSLASSWSGFAGLGLPDVEVFSADEAARRCDVVFTAVPHAHAPELVPPLVAAGVRVVDLSDLYRCSDEAVYGLTEVAREALKGASLVANPGCYPTATSLAALPFVPHTDFVVANCLSGVSGAGRKAGSRNLYCETADAAAAYGVSGTHRHNRELARLGLPVAFTPHLVPMSRGMLATVTCRTSLTEGDARQLVAEFCADNPLLVHADAPPATNHVRGSARAHLFVSVDEGVVTSICAIDNLLKGAAGQAVQNLNVAMGWPETTGLPLMPVTP